NLTRRRVVNHWLLDTIEDKRKKALYQSDCIQFHRELADFTPEIDIELVNQVTTFLHLAISDLEINRLDPDKFKLKLVVEAAADNFRLLRNFPVSDNPIEAGFHLLSASCFAVIGERGADAARWLRSLNENCKWPELPINSENWGER